MTNQYEALMVLYEEIDFLYTRGLLAEHKLGRTEDIFADTKRVVTGKQERSSYYNMLKTRE